MQNLLLTLLVAIVGGTIALKLKVPAGAMIGAMISVAIFNIVLGKAYFPVNAKIVTQIAAGAFVGAGITYRDIISLKSIIKPAVIITLGMISINLIMGYLMHKLTGIDLVTSLFACAPGGIVDMSIISSDLGADTSKVAILQLVRLMGVMLILPSLLKLICNKLGVCIVKDKTKVEKEENMNNSNIQNLFMTLAVGGIFGTIGYLLKIPAGAMTFSMISVGVFNILSSRGYMPLTLRRITQMCAGALIGERMTFNDLTGMGDILFPALMILVGIIVTNLALGFLISRNSNLEITTALFSSAPGGMSDMTLIADELGADTPKVAVLQLVRVISVIALFPIIIKYISELLT
ncbi:AbrB family transcriptional regulator [Clostridium sp. UBA1652]|uniref:AbrB family transcriptional regulator n=1 Tax=Clostridium sp. UBA1652 TaxID=1946348 RepID=UPI00257E88AB|nr:AbrB family transcriptional regulator [Clostridium sp. UBA1652]